MCVCGACVCGGGKQAATNKVRMSRTHLDAEQLLCASVPSVTCTSSKARLNNAIHSSACSVNRARSAWEAKAMRAAQN